MIDPKSLRHGMRVVGSDGQHLGTVDDATAEGIKLAKTSSPDGRHHHIAADRIERVEGDIIYVNTPPPAAVAAAGRSGTGATAGHGAAGAGRRWLPLLLGAIAAIVLISLLLRSCDREAADPTTTVGTTAAPEAGAAATGNGALAKDVQAYLASSEATPRTFTFDRLNFDTSSSAIRAEDRADVDQLAQVLAARPNARVRVVGYADARGGEQPNAQLGMERARAVAAALTAKGVAADRIETASGGEAKPADTNATAGGQFENRRTELVVLSR